MRRRRHIPTELHRQTAHARRGFALADAVVGGTMLAIGLAALISISTRALSAQADGALRVQAAWLADELLSLALVEGPVNYQKMYPSGGSFTAPFEQFEFYIEFRDRGLNVPMEVKVTVVWPGANVPVQLSTLIAQPKGEPHQEREPREVLDRAARWDEILRRSEFGSDVDF